MTEQITGRAAGRRTIFRWAADTAWARASTGRTLPIVDTRVRIRSAQELAALRSNPNIHEVGPLRVGINPATGDRSRYVTVRYADAAHPVRSPRAVRARRLVRRTRTPLAVAAGLATTGTAVAYLWGEQIAAAVRLALTAGLTMLGILTVILLARSINVGHPCPGLHCPNCKGGH